PDHEHAHAAPLRKDIHPLDLDGDSRELRDDLRRMGDGPRDRASHDVKRKHHLRNGETSTWDVTSSCASRTVGRFAATVRSHSEMAHVKRSHRSHVARGWTAA